MSQRSKNENFQIKMCADNEDPFIATLQNVLLAPDLFEWAIFNHYVDKFRT